MLLNKTFTFLTLGTQVKNTQESIRFNASAVVFPVGEDVNHRFQRLVIRASPVAREMSTSPTSARPRKKRRKVGGGDTRARRTGAQAAIGWVVLELKAFKTLRIGQGEKRAVTSRYKQIHKTCQMQS